MNDAYRPGSELPERIALNVLLADGGLGDHIAALPAVKYLIEHSPNVIPLVWVPNYIEEFVKNCLPEIQVLPYSKEKLYNPKLKGVTTKWTPQSSGMRRHLTDYAFDMLLDLDVEDEHKNYLQPDLTKVDISQFDLPEKYVVVTTGFTAEVREFLPKTINEITTYLINKGITPVFLGQTQTNAGVAQAIHATFKEEIDLSKGINLLNKTSLLQACKIISKAQTIVGVDNGLIHLAACTDIPIICGFTTVKPIHREPYRKDIKGWNFISIVPDESLDCRFCQSRMLFDFEHDFKKCYYVEKKVDPSPICVSQMTPNKYIEQLEKIL